MNRSPMQFAFLALTAIVLSAGSAVNASVMTTLPLLPLTTHGGPSGGQTIVEHTGRQVRVKDRHCSTDQVRLDRVIENLRINNLSSDSNGPSLIAFDANEANAGHYLNADLDAADVSLTVGPVVQLRHTLENLPPPVR